MKFRVLILTLLLSFPLFAQKIKVKKNQVLVDKEAVCTITGTGNLYTISTLENPEQAVLKIDYKTLDISLEELRQWLVISNSDDSKTTQIEFETLSFSLNTRKIIAELLYKKYGLINKEGLQQDKIAAFFDEERPNLTEKYEKEKEGATAIVQVNNEYTGNLGIAVTDSGKVTKQDENGTTVTIGKIVAPGQEGPGSTIKVYDLDNNLVAEARFFGNNTYNVDPHSVFPQGGKTFSYKATNRFMPATKAKFLTEIVDQLYIKGYPLEHAIQDYKKSLELEEYQKAIANSPNVYGKKGYVIDAEGNKTEGSITIFFEKIYNPNGALNTDFGLDSNDAVLEENEELKAILDEEYKMMQDEELGRNVSVSYFETTGKKTIKKLVAKGGNRFCVLQEDGSELCYQGLKTIKSSLGLADLANSVKSTLRQYGYFEELVVGPKIGLYKEAITGHFLIKVSTQEKAFRINDAKRKKGKAKLNEYLGGCYFSEFSSISDTSDENQIKGIIDLFNNAPCN